MNRDQLEKVFEEKTDGWLARLVESRYTARVVLAILILALIGLCSLAIAAGWTSLPVQVDRERKTVTMAIDDFNTLLAIHEYTYRELERYEAGSNCL